jgi:hypothetical protein
LTGDKSLIDDFDLSSSGVISEVRRNGDSLELCLLLDWLISELYY